MEKNNNQQVLWSYSGKTGPEYWHTLCEPFAEAAKFPYQSPIALSSELGDPEALQSYEPISFHFQTESFEKEINRQRVHFIPLEKVSYVSFAGKRFYLTDIHFHMPSEHVLNQERLPIEFHLVHMDETGDKLVVGVLFHVEKPSDRVSASKLDWYNEDTTLWFDPSLFLPGKKSHFHYTGSLTTPPTGGPVSWFVFDTVQSLPVSFVEQLSAEKAERNARPIQELNGREIIYYSED